MIAASRFEGDQFASARALFDRGAAGVARATRSRPIRDQEVAKLARNADVENVVGRAAVAHGLDNLGTVFPTQLRQWVPTWVMDALSLADAF